MNKQYDCGKLSNILYPFSGHNRPAQCGGGEQFKLNCEDDRNITTIEIESQNFQVREIDTTSYTMRLVLTHDVCSPQFYDNYLSLSHTPFQYTANVYNLTIFYGCSSGFECGNQNVMWLPRENVSLLEEIQQKYGCQRYIQVPVDAPPESYYSDGGLTVLQGIVGKGFEVKYSVDKGCTTCLQSGGVCGNIKELQFSCYCPDGSNALHCHKNTFFMITRPQCHCQEFRIKDIEYLIKTFNSSWLTKFHWVHGFCISPNNFTCCVSLDPVDGVVALKKALNYGFKVHYYAHSDVCSKC
ncbi:Wall-associated receptor kinase, galacturonan-binding domain [Sesbania bispinosa]|nr:Wall-associated receptor kinase, galacturonan-binding domain [Sesbania bispinosa]